MDTSFKDDEKLYRAVLPAGMYWKDDGTVSSAAFHDRNGLSVDRGDYRKDPDVVRDMKTRGLQGDIVSVKILDCNEVEAVVLYRPTEDNRYHSEIHGSAESAVLTKSQRKRLAKRAAKISVKKEAYS